MTLITPAQAADSDSSLVLTYGITPLQLMENAARGLCSAALEMTRPGARIYVFCGTGNNGGDGYACARMLLAEGRQVSIISAGKHKTVESAHNAAICQAMGIEITAPTENTELNLAPETTLIIDALLGTGIKGEPSPKYLRLIELINSSGKPVLSADIPSGLNGLTGKPLGICVKASVTVTFGAVKIGMVLYPGHIYCGQIITSHIGLPYPLQSEHTLIEPHIVSRWLPKREQDTHKGKNGRVLLLAGSDGMAGAALFTGSAALRTGAGLVYSAISRELYPVLAASAPEIIGLYYDGALDRKHLPWILELCESKDSLVIGPGMSVKAASLVKELLCARLSLPQVWDADALNILSDNLLWPLVPESPILYTPHPGEMARMLGITTKEVQENRLSAAGQFATEKKATTILKGHRTVIALPNGKIYINPTGHPAMATAGMGDALSGILGALLAQGLTPEKAAVCGVYIHGLAGELAAEEIGSRGLTASDLIAKIPAAIDTVYSQFKAK